LAANLAGFNLTGVHFHQGLDGVDGQRDRRRAVEHDRARRRIGARLATEQALQARDRQDNAAQVCQPEKAPRRLGHPGNRGQADDFGDLVRRQRVELVADPERQEPFRHFAA
jgi:hypothetical protein